jgi:putative heme-binding domain-containing protein
MTAPAWAQSTTNPFDTAEAAEQGRVLFQARCGYCHGARGEDERGPDLTTGQYRHGGSDASLFNTIRNGIPGTEMPVVGATEEEAWKLVAFVKRLAPLTSGEKAAGDAAAGKLVYEGKGGCTTCHAIGAEGGNLGPELTDVGRRRDLAYLEESIRKPDADISVRYRALQLVLKNGQTISGVRLNEDDVSIQVRDQKDNLRSFLKSNIREIRRDKPALMPSFDGTLSKKEIDDVVAYLSSLRGVQ